MSLALASQAHDANWPDLAADACTLTPGMAELGQAIERARKMARDRQRSDGSWQERADMGPLTTALVLIALSHVDAISPEDLADGCRWLRNAQLPDGSFLGRPFAPSGDLSATAVAASALSLSPHAEDREASARAHGYLMAHGGLDAVANLAESGDIAPIAMAMARLLAPERVSVPALSVLVLPKLLELASRRVVFYGLTTLLSISLIAQSLRATERRSTWLGERMRAQQLARAVSLLSLYQNRNGSLMNVVYHTALLVPALAAAGVAKTDPRLANAIAWLRSRGARSSAGLFFDVYGSDVWSTASYLRALLLSGASRTDDAVMRATAWLLACQCQTPQPALSNPRAAAVLTGGWGFQSGEDAYPDCDTTSAVVEVLGRVLLPERSNTASLPAPLASRVCAAVGAGRQWLLSMQNPDGGFPSFFWGHPSKRPGPIMLRPLRLRFSDLSLSEPSAWLRRLAESSEHLGDPATEDVTSRVLLALAQTGTELSAPETRRALEFLQQQQCPTGAWWGRWKVNYLPVTACVLAAFARVGDDLSKDGAQRALRWLVSKQNQDGGFGESVDSYRDPSLAGVGPSTAPVTAAVLLGLIAAGQARGQAAARAARYLVDRQRDDGAWDNADCVATLVPPNLFYVYDGAARYMPLEALASYRAELSGGADWHS